MEASPAQGASSTAGIADFRDLQVRLTRVDSPASSSSGSRGRKTKTARRARKIVPGYEVAYQMSRSSSRATSKSDDDLATEKLSNVSSKRSDIAELSEFRKLTKNIDSAIQGGLIQEPQ